MPVKKRSTKRAPARDIAQEITCKLIARLEEGGPLPWRRPWRSSAMAIPLRSTGEPYKGINNLLLHIETACNGYSSPYWMTFKQAKDHGGSVRKGERSSTVVLYVIFGQAVILGLRFVGSVDALVAPIVVRAGFLWHASKARIVLYAAGTEP